MYSMFHGLPKISPSLPPSKSSHTPLFMAFLKFIHPIPLPLHRNLHMFYFYFFLTSSKSLYPMPALPHPTSNQYYQYVTAHQAAVKLCQTLHATSCRNTPIVNMMQQDFLMILVLEARLTPYISSSSF